MISPSRRSFLKTAAATLALPALGAQASSPVLSPAAKRHIVTLSFDDGFKKSFTRTAEIFEKYKLSACLNVIASGHLPDFKPPDQWIASGPRGDFSLWNELQSRAHEVMPHGWAHENLRQLPFEQARDSMQRCLDYFGEHLDKFMPHRAIFNFPYNASNLRLEGWLKDKVRAFRTGGGAINPLPTPGRQRLLCKGFGPGNAEAELDRQIEALLGRESGWLIFNNHGLETEGWGPVRETYLEKLIERLLAIDSVEILPPGKVLDKYVIAENA